MTIRKGLYLFGLWMNLALAWLLTITFFWAFPEGSVTIHINRAGEMWIEAVFLPVALAFGIWSAVHATRIALGRGGHFQYFT